MHTTNPLGIGRGDPCGGGLGVRDLELICDVLIYNIHVLLVCVIEERTYTEQGLGTQTAVPSGWWGRGWGGGLLLSVARYVLNLPKKQPTDLDPSDSPGIIVSLPFLLSP